MTILYLLAYWYTYSKWYILGSWFLTHIFNLGFKKLWLSPLLINAFCLLVFAIGIYIGMIEQKEIGSSILNVYVPIVFFSIIMNVVIYGINIIRNKREYI